MKVALAAAAVLSALTATSALANNILPADGSISSYSTFISGYDFNLAVAENNLLTGSVDPALNNGDPRFIFDNNDSNEFLIVKLSSAQVLNSFSIKYVTDRAPALFEVLTSTDGTTFTPQGSVVPLFGTSGILTASINAPAVTADYIEYYFGAGAAALSTNGAPPAGPGILQLQAGIPEPSTWAMMIVGFIGLGFAMRTRRRAAALAA